MGLVAHPVFKTGRAEQPSAWKVRFLRRSVRGMSQLHIVLKHWDRDLDQRIRQRRLGHNWPAFTSRCAAIVDRARRGRVGLGAALGQPAEELRHTGP
jgi:hypothetical protein